MDDLALIPALANFVATSCALLLIVVSVLILIMMLAFKIASRNWWTYQ